MLSHLSAVADALCSDAKRHGFTLHTQDIESEIPFMGLCRTYASNKHTLHVCTGASADAMSASLALCELLHAGTLPHEVNWVIAPFLNPHGIISGSTLNAQGLDIKNSYKDSKCTEAAAHIDFLKKQDSSFSLSLSLEEDWEATGSYLFAEAPNSEQGSTLGTWILDAIRPFCPIDGSNTINGLQAKEGLILVDQDPKNLPNWTASDYLKTQAHCMNNFRLFIPNERPMNARIQAHKAAIVQIASMLISNSDALPLPSRATT